MFPIQVKTSRSDTWPSKASLWLNVELDQKNKKQINLGPKKITNPDLTYICVLLGDTRDKDRFFVCKKSDIQNVCIASYKRCMDPWDWKRPKNFKS